VPTSEDSTVLGHALATALLGQLGWLLGVAAVVALGVAALDAAAPEAVQRVRRAMLGAGPALPEPAARRFLRISSGLLWIVCGALQAQPAMPTGFVAHVVEPDGAGRPGWIAALSDPFVRAWARHPVTADAMTVWIQVGLGVVFLVAARGLALRLACAAAILWSAVVWTVGEGLGGLLTTGAGWTSGAPGAVLIYLAAAVLLLLPGDWWRSGRATLLARRFAAAWILVGAVLQAIPAEHAWTADGAADPFVTGAANAQPTLLRWPIARLASVAADAPVLVNAVIVVVLLAAGTALWLSARTPVLSAALVVCAASWWLLQDFGVLGGYGTDPNSALPLGVLVALSLPVWARRDAAIASESHEPAGARLRRVRTGVVAASLAAGITAVLVLPAALAHVLPGPADAAAVTADSNGGVRGVPPRPAPAFDLVDQSGVRVSLAGLRGKVVVLTFLDAVCNTDCPLIANQLAIADRRLGPLADRVELVAVDSNPVFRFRRDVAAFTISHGLGDLPNWHFVVGGPRAVPSVLASYGITVQVPAVGMIEHTDAIYFITGDGREAAYLEDGAAVHLTGTYADEVLAELRALLK
jgi:cytochrome oxidase Cu insertion factor (SCO1/SenC/PrrC family)